MSGRDATHHVAPQRLSGHELEGAGVGHLRFVHVQIDEAARLFGEIEDGFNIATGVGAPAGGSANGVAAHAQGGAHALHLRCFP